jgi:hypothetical protein
LHPIDPETEEKHIESVRPPHHKDREREREKGEKKANIHRTIQLPNSTINLLLASKSDKSEAARLVGLSVDWDLLHRA